MNTVSDRRISRVEEHEMQVLAGLMEVYCEHCHLATPTWRKRCLHCAEPLPQATRAKR
jgi:hypothetical protein